MNTPTTPTDTARLTLDAITHGVTQLRASLADAYDRAGNALTEAGHSVAAAEERAENFAARAKAMEHRSTALRKRAQRAEADAERFKADHLSACRTIADMHEAATGRTGMGPIRGVVEDVADMRARVEQAEHRATQWEAARHTWRAKAIEMEADRDREAATREQAQQLLDAHRRSLAAVFALSAETPFEEIREYAARTLNRNGERLLTVEAALTRAKGALQSVRDAEAITDAALTAVAEYDGLSPAAARASAMFAAAAETPAAVEAERERAHAIRLAAAEQARAEAVRVAERATQTLLRIKHAATAADAWTAIGAHFHMTSTDAGRGARRWRSAAEKAAEQRATTAEATLTTIRTISTPEAQQ
ncbi:hypothetical protein ACPXCP_20310 [Streptomyces sp. DT20]|uniref:hypothetical protein n=1 Tax=Streptomyces sp. DT20 TaxID=3416519 RepID=UPI003CEF171B